MDTNGLSDPYVNVFLAPGTKTEDVQTDIKFKTLNPEYHETFTFDGIDKDSLKDKKLHLVVMDYDEFSKDDFLGGTVVNLYELLIAQSWCLKLRRLLDDREVPQRRSSWLNNHGRIELKITYSTEKERFTVHVMKVDRLLKLPSRCSSCNPFVKCHVICKGHILRQKTKICSKTISPDFDEELHYHIKPQDLVFCCMTVTVQDHKKLKDTFLGEVHFDTISFWRSFMSHPNQVIQEKYELKARAFKTQKIESPVNSLPNRRFSDSLRLTNTRSMASSRSYSSVIRAIKEAGYVATNPKYSTISQCPTLSEI